MARIRMIKPEFFDDPDVGELTSDAALFFIGLWTQADREGRLEDDMRRLKARIFPYRAVDVEALAVELHGRDMIRRYQDEIGHGYIWVRNFTKHQRPHPKEPASVIPKCDAPAVERNGKQCKATARPEKELSDQSESGSLDSGSLDSGEGCMAAEFLSFPVIGPGQSWWSLSEVQVAEWGTLFPGSDVRGESRKALAWVQASPMRRKTAKGMARFLVSWLTRAVDSGRTSRYEPSAGSAVPMLGKQTTRLAAAIASIPEES